MKYVKCCNNARNAIIIKKNEYQTFIDVILRHTEIVCFTVCPYLDHVDELREDIRYKQIMGSYIDSECAEALPAGSSGGYGERLFAPRGRNDGERRVFVERAEHGKIYFYHFVMRASRQGSLR